MVTGLAQLWSRVRAGNADGLRPPIGHRARWMAPEYEPDPAERLGREMSSLINP
jgi:hypothetical protein